MGLAAPIPVEVTGLPSLEPPDADEFLHLYDRGSKVADCGAGVSGHTNCPRKGMPWKGERFCPACGRPVCPTCLDIVRTLERTGIVP